MAADSPDRQADSASPDLDPLQEFFAELQASTHDVVEPQQDSAPPADRPAVFADTEMALRLARSEKLLEQTALDMASLKADLATLVGALDDMKKRQSRRVDVPVRALPPRLPRLTRAGTAVAALLVLVAGFALWGVYAVASYAMAERPPAESAPADPAAPTAPAASSVAPPAQLEKAAVTSAALPVADAPAREIAMPPTRAPAPAARAPAHYVGTLTIDASPAGEVFLNRKSVGRTPLRLERLRAGSHLIWIERDGHRRWTRVVAVAADRISRVSADLDPLPR